MSDFTRITVVGSQRRAVVVVPNDETVGTLVPQLMDLLGEPAARVARPLTLTRLTGEQLDPDRSPAELAVADGELLRLVRLDEAPPPPEVSDVTDAVSDSLADRHDRWDAPTRVVAGAVGIGLAAAGAGLSALAAPAPAPLLPAAAWALALLAALALGLGRLRRAQGVALAVALGLVPAVALPAAALLSGRGPVATAIAVGVLLALLWTTLLLGHGVASRSRAATLGALLGLGGAVLPLVLLAVGLPLGRVGAVTAVVAVVAVGLLPAAAMSASGLAALDDRVIAGRLTRRDEVRTTLASAYRTLTWSTAALAATLAAALTATVLGPDPWLLGTAGAVALVVALRTRAFPLRWQVLALWAAVAVPAAVAIAGLLVPAAAAGTFALVAVVVGVLAGVSPAPHRRAGLRRVGTVLEAVAVVALVPLVIGAFGVYAELLGAFR
ncbi:EsaB/YukD family protein [Amnibacterium setariae]|uniref:EccD-like transmembrane domain-containing protein n=1 Tax=Amnibacterium setariae TaxID=2306585 RepID=A0A3A1TXZ2_9MICO|nr:EsaB/YukD family protein [Amnibacterium setariae]RIX28468.1 hypothetical protein D1781_13665 [Amnibacterium setariae]